MELRQYLKVLSKWWWLIVISVTVAAVASLLGSLATPRTYVSHTTIMVGQALQTSNPNATDIYTGQTLAQFYSELVRREPVVRATLDALDLKWDWTALQSMVTSRPVPGTQLLEISVLDTDPQRARILANEVAHQLILQSPSGTDPARDAERQFMLSQIDTLKSNIKKGQDDLQRLDNVIATANSARQMQDALGQKTALQTQISTWQTTYAQLIANVGQGSTNALSIVEPAQTPTTPVDTSTLGNILIAATIGFVLACGAAFLLDYLDDTIKSPDDVQRALEMPILASVTHIDGEDMRDKLITLKQPRSSAAESYRILRTNLQFKGVDKPLHTLLVTSGNPQEGKSVTAANLAVVMAQAGLQVMLVDADLRRPALHEIFGLKNDRGLSSLLVDANASPSDVLQAVGVDNLKVITSGTIPPNPSELLGSKRMGYLIEILQKQADFVIFDSPPVLAAADTTVLATRLDGTILVVEAGSTRRPLAKRCKGTLAAVSAPVLGVVLNRSAADASAYAYYDNVLGERQRKQPLYSSWLSIFSRNGRLSQVTGRFRPAAKQAAKTKYKTD